MDKIKQAKDLAAGTAEWKTGLFGCTDTERCAYGLCCWPCANATARTNVDESSCPLNGLMALACAPCFGLFIRSVVRSVSCLVLVWSLRALVDL
jgi:hypothetical protein